MGVEMTYYLPSLRVSLPTTVHSIEGAESDIDHSQGNELEAMSHVSSMKNYKGHRKRSTSQSTNVSAASKMSRKS